MNQHLKSDPKQEFAAQRRTADLLAQVKAGVQAVRDSEAWKAWLKVASTFYTYSACNAWLIALQRPDATKVRGFQQWKSLGRCVKKGEKGIAILAPIFIKAETESAGGEVLERRVRFFKTVFVFDIAQTEGPELPEIAHTLQGSADELLAELRAKALGLGFSVREEPLPEALGGFVDASRTITLNSSLPSRHRSKTLIHELAHGLLGHTNSELSRERKELEAETAAWVVSKQLGLESDEYSFGYLAAWSAQALNYTAQLEAASENALRAARLILAEVQDEQAQAA